MSVVVTGIGVVSPLGNTVEEFWAGLKDGVSGAERVRPPGDPAGRTWNAFPVRDFSPERYMDRKQARRMDRCSQFAVAAAVQAVEDARLDLGSYDPYRIAVSIGTALGGLSTFEAEHTAFLGERGGRVGPLAMPMLLGNMPAAQVAMRLGLKGPALVAATACASATDAIGQALSLLEDGRADVVLAGGAEAAITPFALAAFSATGALSRRDCPPHEASRPFDIARDGFVMGEGAAIMILEKEEEARRRGARIWGRVLGYGASADAYHVTAPDETGDGLVRAMLAALADAGLGPEAVDYINAHGTSTPVNDRVETLAIKRVLGERAYRVPISSTKSMVGHLCGAAGALEAAATLLCLAHGFLHPTINLTEPDPECDLDYVPNRGRPCDARIGVSNSMGFGGHNAVLVLGRP